MTNETERQFIIDLWPDHVPHLVPEDNKLGQPFTDTEHGIVCNCGDVLGWPENAPQPAEVVEVVEHRYNAAADQSAMASGDTEDAVPLAEPSEEDMSEEETAALVMSGAYGEPPDDVQEQAVATFRRRDPGADPADEAQAARYIDVHLPPVTDEQITRAGEALAGGDREGFHQALSDSPPMGSGNLPARRADVVDAEDPIAARMTIIDPSLPYGPADVEHQLLDIAARIERGVHFQRSWEERHHYAKVGFELASARALVKATGGDAATRKAQALLECEQEYLELAVCETMIRAIRECMHNLRSLQSGYQTVARSVGASIQNLPQRGA